MLAWLNDTLLPVEQLRIDPRDRGVLLGDGLFETLLAVSGQPTYLAEHLARLRAGCALLGLPLPWSDASIGAAISQLLEAEALTQARAAVRVTLTRGVGPRGLLAPAIPSPNLLLTAAVAPAATGPVRAIVSTIRRNEHSPLSQIKSLSYLDSVLAAEQARRQGSEEALLLNTSGLLAEASAANLFLVRDGRLSTPRVVDGALPGIVRARVLELAPGLGLEATECPCTEEALRSADEVLLTNSVVIVRPVVQVDGQQVGAGEPGPWTRALLGCPELAGQL